MLFRTATWLLKHKMCATMRPLMPKPHALERSVIYCNLKPGIHVYPSVGSQFSLLKKKDDYNPYKPLRYVIVITT